MWPKVHTQVMIGLVLAQLVLTFIFAIKKTVWAPIITAITLLGSLIFHSIVVKQFNPPQAQMSYRAATNADHNDEVRSAAAHVPVARTRARSVLLTHRRMSNSGQLPGACSV